MSSHFQQLYVTIISSNNLSNDYISTEIIYICLSLWQEAYDETPNSLLGRMWPSQELPHISGVKQIVSTILSKKVAGT